MPAEPEPQGELRARFPRADRRYQWGCSCSGHGDRCAWLKSGLRPGAHYVSGDGALHGLRFHWLAQHQSVLGAAPRGVFGVVIDYADPDKPPRITRIDT